MHDWYVHEALPCQSDIKTLVIHTTDAEPVCVQVNGAVHTSCKYGSTELKCPLTHAPPGTVEH